MFCEKLRASLLEEYKDVAKYNQMAVTAEEAYKPILKAIAKEEWSHAERLKEILYDMDGTLNQCELAARDEAKNSIEGSK
jgi:rubrerythrin